MGEPPNTHTHKSPSHSPAQLTRVYLEVGTKVAGVTESLATEIAFVGLHAHVAHEVDVQLGRGDEGLRAHGALPLPLLAVAGPVTAAVALAGEVAVDVAGQMGLELCVGAALLPAVAEVHVRVLGNTLKGKSLRASRHSSRG